ncbi:nuclear transport factor 2 family protein [Tsuneonella flava]|uniref:nuclear transport factor 2 family protein n=1 Tax=Tsuneonella flava TaxID=2055955 RepID=UPI001F291E4F|nr:nuclear transport factor 2 family protein [Tsuneonella flava]
MTIELPGAIADYFAADKKGNAEAISKCFTQDSVVVDEGNTYTGRDAIRQWMAHASTQYSYTVEPFALGKEGERTVVTSHLVGNFPGARWICATSSSLRATRSPNWRSSHDPVSDAGGQAGSHHLRHT